MQSTQLHFFTLYSLSLLPTFNIHPTFPPAISFDFTSSITSFHFMPVAVNPVELTEEDARQLVETFLKYDADDDKQLSLSEFREFLKEAKVPSEFADLAFVVFDNDKSGKIDFEEFVEFIIYLAVAQVSPRAYFARAFEAFDADKSGKLDAAELSKFLQITGVPNAAEVAAAAIAQAGGGAAGLTFEQFATALELPAE
jgi:Ca2+-binding EF-hand superfamily protein